MFDLPGVCSRYVFGFFASTSTDSMLDVQNIGDTFGCELGWFASVTMATKIVFLFHLRMKTLLNL